MTEREFEAWTAETARSRGSWLLDPVFQASGRTMFYRGGEDGTYVTIVGAEVEVGSYEGAVPHIGEALFHTRCKKQFPTEAEASLAVAAATGVRACCSVCGKSFVVLSGGVEGCAVHGIRRAIYA